MRSRRVALLFAPLAIAFACSFVTGCKGQTVPARSRFVEDGVQKVADAGWDAERIDVDTAGVSPSGGLALAATDTDRVVATARMLAVADTYDKASADRAILGATDTFFVSTTDGVTRVQCGHGPQVGSAASAESGCDALDVSVPSGTALKPVSVVARSGNGNVGVSFGGATLAGLDLHASHGGIDATTSATAGATIAIVSDTDDDVILRLPRDFAADTIILDAPSGKVDTRRFLTFRQETRAARPAGGEGDHRPWRAGSRSPFSGRASSPPRYFTRAIASISTRAPFGSAETWTVARAGGAASKRLPYVWLTTWKSPRSTR